MSESPTSAEESSRASASSSPSSATGSAPAPRFEESLQELQRIVQQLEGGSLTLEDSLAGFERGIGLLRTCYRQLEVAEQKIELLTGFSADQQPITIPFDATSTLEAREQTAGRRRSTTAAEPAAADSAAQAAASADSPADKGTSEPPRASGRGGRSRKAGPPTGSVDDAPAGGTLF